MNGVFHLFPPSASTAAGRFDTLFLALFLLISFVAIAVTFLIVYFSVRYRRNSRADRTAAPARGRRLEIAWTVIPLLLFLAIFAWAAYDYTRLYRVPENAMPVFVVAKQWMWKLEHVNGRREIDELHVPLGQPVRLVMTSQDVIHSFFVPAFRIKQDVVPGRYTTIWFTATQAGEFHLFCAEYCGTDHAAMRGRIVVMQPNEFAAWLQSGNAQAGMAAHGFELYRRYGCSGCHEPQSSVHAPDLHGLLGRTVHLQDGRTIVADETYIHDSVLLPKKDVVAGFDPIMPSFAGQISEEDLLAIIEFIRSTGGRDARTRQ
ncbi:MAG TPA: cytochrome c oxidase subunit II [Noviherbaspirillum sp.]|uniref:cytochrome c oxidase subunit II n=1 Tax=Noviherbaspirillum sp. TaxID=1926288 RepID=UPI002B46A7B5|nr:cytochrome c oxidase subunit II [Noviherbaspirillum sp.]HJV83892.1 cytochrome c oxidase subunit II [Noviherbaspirillum sp.]